MTAALVLISLEMTANGSASMRNPAWVFVSHIRNAFVGVGVGTVSLIAFFWIVSVVIAAIERDAQWEKDQAERLESEERKRIEEREFYRNSAIEYAREKMEAEEEKAKTKERELALKAKAAELEKVRRLRSAKEATDQAAKDFL